MKLGIIGAMDFEVSLLIEQIENDDVSRRAGLYFHQGKISGVECVVVTSGIGKVNAAMCAQILICDFEVTHIINTGVAGALAPELGQGDVVISTDLIQHDFNMAVEGLEKGIIPRMKTSTFIADEYLRGIAHKAADATVTDFKVVEGRIVSGDVFIGETAYKHSLYEQFKAKATEMEGAAIAHVGYLNKVPFVIIRAISDTADGKAVSDYGNFFIEAAKRSAAMVISMIVSMK